MTLSIDGWFLLAYPTRFDTLRKKSALRRNKLEGNCMLNPTESIYDRYEPAPFPEPGYEGPCYWFVFSSGKLLVREEDGQVRIPCVEDADTLSVQAADGLYLGTWEGVPSYTQTVQPEPAAPEGFTFTGLRSLYGVLDEGLFHLAGRAAQIGEWDRAHRFCGRCGGKMVPSEKERAKHCPSCGLTSYPPISPAVITAIFKGDRILLAHAAHFSNNMYSLIAGFVEPGETLEDAVRREIREEVGISVRNVRYFGSQQWPFPNSLMIGFTAEYDSGKIAVDGEEIVAADWFTADNLPELPSRISIARKIIDWYAEQQRR
jgi:NAD+ diphosphatase